MTEPEILIGRRAFPEAQRLLAGVPRLRLPDRVDIGWYGTETHPEQGAFAVVSDAGTLGDLVGEVLRITSDSREAFVYVVGARGVPTDIALARRAFLSLARLSFDSAPFVVEVVG